MENLHDICAYVPTLPMLPMLPSCFFSSFFSWMAAVVAWPKSNFPVHSLFLCSHTHAHTTQQPSQSKESGPCCLWFFFSSFFSYFTSEECTGHTQSKAITHTLKNQHISTPIHHTPLTHSTASRYYVFDMHDMPNILADTWMILKRGYEITDHAHDDTQYHDLPSPFPSFLPSLLLSFFSTLCLICHHCVWYGLDGWDTCDPLHFNYLSDLFPASLFLLPHTLHSSLSP